MALYAFTFVNHLGEGFGTTTIMCRDDGHALECGQPLTAQGYPVDVRDGDRLVATLPACLTELSEWSRYLRERWPSD
jgi:hypothetical protein